MKQTAERMVNVTNEVMELTIAEMMTPDTIQYMDETNLKLLKLTLELIKVSNDYIIKSTEIIEGLDRKMNELLELTGGA